MKFIHTADWHLGNTFHGYDRQTEHRAFLDRLLTTIRTEEPDALLIAGDVFDNSNPSAAAEEMFYDFLDSATHENEGLQIVVIAGNHDSAARLEAPAALLRRRGVTALGLIERDEKGEPLYDRLLVTLKSRRKDEGEEALLMAIPYLRPSDLKSGMSYAEGMRTFIKELTTAALKRTGRRTPLLAMAHFYATGAEVVEDNHSERLIIGGAECVDSSVFDRSISYTALGHIHKEQPVAGNENIRYAGSALPLSFSERSYSHGVTLVTLTPDGKATATPIRYDTLRPLISIPSKGDSCTPDEALAEIERLPRCKEKDSDENWPYLEVLIKDRNPDPTLRHRIEVALEGRAVHLCRVERVQDEAEETDDKPTFESIEKLRSITPLDMARTVYRIRYGEDMPQNWVALFREAEENVHQQKES